MSQIAQLGIAELLIIFGLLGIAVSVSGLIGYFRWLKRNPYRKEPRYELQSTRVDLDSTPGGVASGYINPPRRSRFHSDDRDR